MVFLKYDKLVVANLIYIMFHFKLFSGKFEEILEKYVIMISKTCGYGIRGVVFLALKSTENRNIGIVEVAESLNIPQPFMGKVLQELARKGIIQSAKGPKGGFFVKKETLQLPLLTIVEALDGLGVLKKCYLGREECSAINPCPLHEQFDTGRSKIFDTFKTKNVEDLMDEVLNGAAFINNS